MKTEINNCEFLKQETDMQRNINKSIMNALKSHRTYESIRENDWTDKVLAVMEHPAMVKAIMEIYDLKWGVPDHEFDEFAGNLTSAYESLCTNEGDYIDLDTGTPIDRSEVCIAIWNYLSRIRTARGKMGVNEDYGIAAEPEVSYGNPVRKVCGDWKRVYSLDEIPVNNPNILVAGYYYPGLIVYKALVWNYEHARWVFPKESDEKMFKPLYWKAIEPLPADYIEQI